MDQQTILSWVLLFVLFYVVLFLPRWLQSRQRRKREEEIAKLKVGDEVVTMGGLIGKIVRAEGDIVVLELAPKMQVRILRSALGHKREKETERKKEEKQ